METAIETRRIEIDQETLRNLNTTRKWTMFLAIIGFIFLGIIIVIVGIAGTFLSAFNLGEAGSGIPESLMFMVIFGLAVVYFLPLLFLFRFSKHTTQAVQTLDNLELKKAFKNLKSYFRYLGVLIIIVLTLYLLAIVLAGPSMAFLKGL
jgi:hypothetical protein